jgi:hypothetical protein
MIFMRFGLLLILAVFVFGFACTNGEKIKQGNNVAAKIEKFKTEKGGLPNSLSEIGIEEKMEGPIYYRKESETKYILWFGEGLGESVTYDSDTKTWK